MKATFKLLNSYYFKGFFGPFFVIVFPVLILFILSNAMNSTAISTGNQMQFMSNLIGGILITALISNGLMGLPTTIIEFKKSTLIKRIGAADVSKTQFFIAVLSYQLLWSLFSVVWVLFWGGLLIGTKSGYDWSVAFNSNFWISLPYMALTILISISIGLLIVSLVNTQQGVMGITNVIYLPITMLSGGFLPKTQIDSSSVLSGISWVLPTKYVVDPFFQAFNGGLSGLSDYGWEAWGYPLIAIGIVGIALVVVVKKFKWSN